MGEKIEFLMLKIYLKNMEGQSPLIFTNGSILSLINNPDVPFVFSFKDSNDDNCVGNWQPNEIRGFTYIKPRNTQETQDNNDECLNTMPLKDITNLSSLTMGELNILKDRIEAASIKAFKGDIPTTNE